MWWLWALAFLVLLACLAAWWWREARLQREITRLDEEKQMLQQEKEIVLEFMHSLVDAIGEGVPRHELFQRVVHSALLSTGATSACIFELTPDKRLRAVAVEGLFPPLKAMPTPAGAAPGTRTQLFELVLRPEEFDLGEGLLGQVASTAKGLHLRDATTDPRVPRHSDAALAVRSLLLAPITFRKNLLGVVAVANPADGLAFDETDFSLVQSLAEQAGLAIHNSDLLNVQLEKRRLDLDLAIASSVQNMLLPRKFPAENELDIAAVYVPAQAIGGDLYDVFSLGPGRLGVAIADVSGKGIAASLLMAICQSNLRHLARQYSSPSRVLTALHQVVIEEIQKGMFITLTYAVVDLIAGRITWARAGHELPLLFRRDVHSGAVTELTLGSEGMAIGLGSPKLFEACLTENSIDFQRGDTLLLYTDGAVEALDAAGNEFGRARLADAVRRRHLLAMQGLTTGLLDDVRAYAIHHRPSDDVTLLAIHRR